jgi:hypothetical protein
MTSADLLAAIDLPTSAYVNQRVPKSLLVKNGAPTAADKRRINEGIEELKWLATLKPATIGVPEFRDGVREYLEIATLSAELRPGAQTKRLAELIHRAIPYPVFLISELAEELTISLAHKRWSLATAGETVIDGTIVITELQVGNHKEINRAFLKAISLIVQPRTNLYTLYQGWMDTILAMEAARVTGTFRSDLSPEHALARRDALRECAQLDAEIAHLRAAANNEKQIPRQVALNLELKRVEAQLAIAREKL